MSSDTPKRSQDPGTPSGGPKGEEPQPKVPRRVLGEGDLPRRIKEMQARVHDKKELSRKLNLVKTYRSKWETQDLATLTHQWLEVCQAALEDLRIKLRERTATDTEHSDLTLKTLITSLGIDPELVHLNEEDDCFYT